MPNLKHPSRQGFTLYEILLVISIIAVLATMGISRMSSTRVTRNENAALANLRRILASQQEVITRGSIDTDVDGKGEYAFLGELTGQVPIRVYDGFGLPPVLGVAPVDLLEPTSLGTAFGEVVEDGMGHGAIEHSGYFYKVYLPDNGGPGIVSGLGEDPAGGAGAQNLLLLGSNEGERYWCVYAWPVKAGSTGRRVFFINQDNELSACANTGLVYDGLGAPPGWDAAYDTTNGASMENPVGLAALGRSTSDGQVWNPTGD